MKKKSRSLKSSELSQHSRRACEGKRPCGSRRKTQRNSHMTAVTSDLRHRDDKTGSTYTLTDKHKHSDVKSKSSRISTDMCRLCHGKFSPRSLLPAFNKWPQDFPDIVHDEAYAVDQSPPVFHVDFQQLVGVQLDPDPRLSEFVCKKCHSEFYKCHNILVRFLQMVNHLPLGKDNSNRHNPMFSDSLINDGSTISQTLSSDTACLHNLVSWAHHHGEACKSCPDLKEVLEGQCWGSVKAVWCCVAGHSYTIDTQSTTSARFGYVLNSGESGNGARDISREVDCDGRSTAVTAICLAQQTKPAVTPLIQSSALADWTCSSQEFAEPEDAVSPAEEQQDDKQADSDLFDRATGPKKQQHIPNTSEEHKVKKKPGPKPGWKRNFKPKGEELPNIYKCLYQGCIAVYRAPDGLKKHVKEHHEEVKERPCPHPGCNKVFTIDRYLQRHVKLILTERNYICDQCGQTFKQRKHLSVHQMRHSGVKPLQCEVCGFQCRQRASLKYHMTKHKAEADLEFACLICSKRFEKAHNLNVHMSMVHPLTQTKVQKGGNQQKPHIAISSHQNIIMSGESMPQEQGR
ncbi:zinc finger protein 276 isoform X2 [Hippocampus comes]|uniref:zinc finger protein 276 isoform X2 n=1 Tax=Hippocampus comes TaxID=109280 RepID=UPI00094E819C|nr:PREDICTED: zinc finger protein 276-like isoform X2 [Hippocampus comes]